jgi:hypothetical protein
VAADALFDLVSSVEPRLAPLREWYYHIIHTTEKWYLSEQNQGVKRMKDILHVGWLRILGESSDPMTFVKQNDKGLPDLVIPLVRQVMKSMKAHQEVPRLLSMCESLIRLTDLWRGQLNSATVEKGLEVIEGSKLPKTAGSVITKFEEFLVELYNNSSYRDLPVVKAIWKAFELNDGDVVRYSTKMGPNGRLTLAAHKDYVSLKNNRDSKGRTMVEALKELQERIIQSSVNPTGWKATDSYEGLDLSKFYPQEPDTESLLIPVSSSTKEGKTSKSAERALKREEKRWMAPPADTCGRISFISEKSGKLRLVASPDYWSQVTLAPIHRWLENVLRNIDEDCTFDQRSALPKICQWQLSGRSIYSFDQSSCTDLFPFNMQLKVLEKRFGKPLTEALHTVMVDRDWEVIVPKSRVSKKLKWSVGQPMGLLGSWPLMALTHHLLVQFASWRTLGVNQRKRWVPFKDYVICGDDIVIASKQVADSYLRLVRLLGMKINMLKSHISGGVTGVPPTSEFAKVTIREGNVLLPVKPNQVLAAVRDWTQAVPLLCECTENRYIKGKLRKLKPWISKYFPKQRRILEYLLTVPQNAGGVGLSPRSKAPVPQTHGFVGGRVEINPLLVYLCGKVRSAIKRVEQETDVLKDALWHPCLDPQVARKSPIYEYFQQMEKSRSWRFKVFRSEIPSLKEILSRVLIDGWVGLEDYLAGLSSISPVPAWDSAQRELEVKENSLSWARVLDHPVTISVDDLKAYYRSVGSLFSSAGYELSLPVSADKVTSPDYQEALCKKGLMIVTAGGF